MPRCDCAPDGAARDGRSTRSPARRRASSTTWCCVRNDGVPAYNLAVVVDDHLQGVTEVVRGDDLLSSTPRQVLPAAAARLRRRPRTRTCRWWSAPTVHGWRSATVRSPWPSSPRTASAPGEVLRVAGREPGAVRGRRARSTPTSWSIASRSSRCRREPWQPISGDSDTIRSWTTDPHRDDRPTTCDRILGYDGAADDRRRRRGSSPRGRRAVRHAVLDAASSAQRSIRAAEAIGRVRAAARRSRARPRGVAGRHQPAPVRGRAGRHRRAHLAAPAQVWPYIDYHGLRDVFVIRYALGEQESLRIHHDVAQVSASVKLNDGLRRRRARLPASGLHERRASPVGELLVWPSLVTHPHQTNQLRQRREVRPDGLVRAAQDLILAATRRRPDTRSRRGARLRAKARG